jgi:hypothetical protein
MLTWFIGIVAVVVWVSAYVWYAWPEIKSWWKRRKTS